MTAITLDGLSAYFPSIDVVPGSLDDAIWETGNANMGFEFRYGTHEKAVRESQFKGWIVNRTVHTPTAVGPRSQRLQAGPQVGSYDRFTAALWQGPAALLIQAVNPIASAEFKHGSHAKAVYESQFKGKIWGQVSPASISDPNASFLSFNFIAEGQAYRDSPSSVYGRAQHAPPLTAPRIVRTTGRPQDDPTIIPARLWQMPPAGAQSPPIARFKAVMQELPDRNDSFVMTRGKFVGGTDIVPDQFNFVDMVDVPINGVVTSLPITITGINAPSPITVVAGEFSINGGAFQASPAFVNEFDQVRARHVSSASFLGFASTVITVGGISDTFTSQTVADSAEDLRVLVPYLIGDTLQAAIQHLASVYLLYAVNGTTQGTVTAQSVDMGVLVARGTTITLTLGGEFNFSNRRKQQHGLPIFGSPED